MMLKIDTTTKLYTKEKADKIVQSMNDQDDDWTYTAVHDPKGTGFSFIEAYDENGELVGTM